MLRRFVDISVPLETGIISDPPIMLPEIEYMSHDQTAEQVMGSVMVADPIRVLDCSPITDGAAALILCPAERAKERSKSGAGVGLANIRHRLDNVFGDTARLRGGRSDKFSTN